MGYLKPQNSQQISQIVKEVSKNRWDKHKRGELKEIIGEYS